MEDRHKLERLSVSEAAEKLQISKDAVRKRMQRGTLRHDKTLDGHVYVYLGSGKEPDEDDNAKKVAYVGERRSPSLTALANTSAIFAALGIGIYVLGLISLLMPISRTFTHDLSAAWYAVAVLPKTVAAGQGASLLAQFLVFYLLGLGFCAILLLEFT